MIDEQHAVEPLEDRLSRFYAALTRAHFDRIAKSRRRGRLYHVDIRPDGDPWFPTRRLTIKAASHKEALDTAWKAVKS